MWTLGGGGTGRTGRERPARARDKQGVGALVGPLGTVTDTAICTTTGGRKYNRTIFRFTGRGKPSEDLVMESVFLHSFRK